MATTEAALVVVEILQRTLRHAGESPLRITRSVRAGDGKQSYYFDDSMALT